MKESNRLRKLFKIKTCSPLGFLCWAALMAAFFLICHLAGWREQTTFISGTAAEANDPASSAIKGMVYLISYFAFVLATPILILGAGIFSGLSTLTQVISKSRLP